MDLWSVRVRYALIVLIGVSAVLWSSLITGIGYLGVRPDSKYHEIMGRILDGISNTWGSLCGSKFLLG